jgi:ring-1,2-phenylacetyl-CoA epoxidase subunit PaaE
MSNQHFILRVIAITRETSDAVTIHFEHPEKQPILYKPGQFLTLIIPFEGKKVRRSYSLSSTPYNSSRLSVTVKRVAGGLVSNYLVDTLQIGQEIEVMEPIGNFCLTCDSNQTRHIVLLGAGSGITPLMSILKSVLHEEQQSKVTLVYGNRDEDTVIFKEELESLGKTYADRLKIKFVYSQPKLQPKQQEPVKKSFTAKLLSSFGLSNAAGSTEISGRLNHRRINNLLEQLGITKHVNALYYICGPEGFMGEATKALGKMQIPSNAIFLERFVQKKQTESQGPMNVTAVNSNPVTQKVTILIGGKEYQLNVQPDKTILEAALDENIDMPYSCQAGLCTACMGKCLSGEVRMDEHDGLSESELKEGYVLNCMAHPITDDVVIKI